VTTPEPFAVSGLRFQALVSELLYSEIQRQRLLTELGLLRASRTLAAVYQETMYFKIQSIRLLTDLLL
jgi:hypothetical protein